MRHTHEVRLVNAPAIVGESVLLNLLPAEEHVRPITLRAIAPCVFWVLTLKDLQHIFQVTPLAAAPPRGGTGGPLCTWGSADPLPAGEGVNTRCMSFFWHYRQVDLCGSIACMLQPILRMPVYSHRAPICSPLIIGRVILAQVLLHFTLCTHILHDA